MTTGTIAPRPAEVFEAQRLSREFSEGMDKNADGKPVGACRSEREADGWQAAQDLRELPVIEYMGRDPFAPILKEL